MSVLIFAIPYDGRSRSRNTLGLDAEYRRFAVVIQIDGSLSFRVEFHIGHPVQGTAIVFCVRQGLLAVIGAIEVFAYGISVQHITSVTVCGLVAVVGE